VPVLDDAGESGGAGGEGVQVGLGGRWKGWGASVSIDERGSDDPEKSNLT